MTKRPAPASAPGLQRHPADAFALLWLYVARGAAALVWAGVFTAVSGSLTNGAVVLLIIYPVIDVIASLVDARTHRGSPAQHVQLINAGISAVATIAVAVAAAHDTGLVLRVFGVWAIVSGLVQLRVAYQRRPVLGWQWSILVSGGLSVLAGLLLNFRARAADPSLKNIAVYAVFGGAFFLIGAIILLARTRKAPAQTP